MKTTPFGFDLNSNNFIPSAYDNHIKRHLSKMAGQYIDDYAFQEQLKKEDLLLYEVYEIRRPEIEGELLNGISIVHPGKIGDEYFMTKGHFHTVLETAEVYYCLNGHGYMVMETPEGVSAIEELLPGRVLYVPPRWAHRSVNVSPDEDLITFFVYPGHAGHDYGTIEEQGFRQLILEQDGRPQFIENPRWKKPAP